MRYIYFLFLLVLVLFTIAFSVHNSEVVVLSYYFGKAEIPLSLALGLALLLGCLLGVLASMKTIISAKYELRSLRREVGVANKEIANLRSIPIKDEH